MAINNTSGINSHQVSQPSKYHPYSSQPQLRSTRPHRIEWLYSDDDEDNQRDDLYELTGWWNGKYIDIVKESKYSWGIKLDNNKIKSGFASREAAKGWIEFVCKSGSIVGGSVEEVEQV